METSTQPITIISSIISVVIAFIGLYFYAYKRGFNQGVKDSKNENQRKRYELIYSPINALFLTMHISASQIVNAPFFRKRLYFCWQQLKQGNFKRAFHKLWDRQEGKVTAEFEYGDIFPLKEIQEIIKGREQYADGELLSLIKRADYSKYDDSLIGGTYPWEDSRLTDAELELSKHIWKTHSRLNKIFVPSL